jgi:hypothetical protein
LSTGILFYTDTNMSDDAWAKVYLAIYAAVGIPVAWLHMRQQGMHESTRQSRQSRLVIFTLAVMWPLLLLSMLLNHFQAKPTAGKIEPKKPDASVK